MNQERARQVLAFIILHQLALSSSGESVSSGVSAQEQQGVSDNVLSQENMAQAMSWTHGSRLVLNFTEDLIAVKIPKILVFVAILLFFWLLTSVVMPYINGVLVRAEARKSVQIMVNFSMYLLLIFLALAVALAAIGIELFALLIAFSVIGVALATSIAVIVNNITGGYSVQVNEMFGVGDTVTIEGTTGTVIWLNLTHVALESVDGNRDITFVANSAAMIGKTTWHNMEQRRRNAAMAAHSAAATSASGASAAERLGAFVVQPVEGGGLPGFAPIDGVPVKDKDT